MGDRAKDWLFYLPPGSIMTLAKMATLFLEKNFPASIATSIRRDICSIKQKDLGNLHEYWEQFKQLCASYPQHEILEQLLIQYFYKGLLPMERRMMDVASGGAIVNKTSQATRELNFTMAANAQQFGFRHELTSRRVNEVSITGLEQ